MTVRIRRISRKSSPRLPRKRGPKAWCLALRADEILDALGANNRHFHSLRSTARIFGVSTKPLRTWTRLGYLKREGPRGQFGKQHLVRFIEMLKSRATPFGSDDYLRRIFGNSYAPCPFEKLSSSRFVWPRGRIEMTPTELAERIQCHPSLIINAIRADRLRGKRRTMHRWVIRRGH